MLEGLFFFAVLWTVIKSREYSPEQLAAFEKAHQKAHPERVEVVDKESNINTQFISGLVMAVVGLRVSAFVYFGISPKELYILFIGLLIIGVLFMVVSQLRKKEVRNGFTV
jgi:maltose/moltooligosaccharide transporter